MKRIFWVYLGLFVLFTLSNAADKPKPITELVGKTYIEVMRSAGFPNAIFPVRQSTPDRDDVVFDYEYSYYYFYLNRLYRVFYSSKYEGDIYKGLKIGDGKKELTNRFGSKYSLETDGLIWKLDKVLVIAKLDERNRLHNIWFITKVEKQ